MKVLILSSKKLKGVGFWAKIDVQKNRNFSQATGWIELKFGTTLFSDNTVYLTKFPIFRNLIALFSLQFLKLEIQKWLGTDRHGLKMLHFHISGYSTSFAAKFENSNIQWLRSVHLEAKSNNKSRIECLHGGGHIRMNNVNLICILIKIYISIECYINEMQNISNAIKG